MKEVKMEVTLIAVGIIFVVMIIIWNKTNGNDIIKYNKENPNRRKYGK